MSPNNSANLTALELTAGYDEKKKLQLVLCCLFVYANGFVVQKSKGKQRFLTNQSLDETPPPILKLKKNWDRAIL